MNDLRFSFVRPRGLQLDPGWSLLCRWPEPAAPSCPPQGPEISLQPDEGILYEVLRGDLGAEWDGRGSWEGRT